MHLSLHILFNPFKAKYFFVFWCFADSSHRLNYCINPLLVRQQYFLGLCKFYSSDHQIMQSSILKYFKLRQDKKLLWFSVRIWTRDTVMDGGWNFSQVPPEVVSVYSKISIIFCRREGGWCMVALRIIYNHFLACYRLSIRKPDKLWLDVLLKFNIILIISMTMEKE